MRCTIERQRRWRSLTWKLQNTRACVHTHTSEQHDREEIAVHSREVEEEVVRLRAALSNSEAQVDILKSLLPIKLSV